MLSTGIANNRPNTICDPVLDHPTIAQWFNTACEAPAVLITNQHCGTGEAQAILGVVGQRAEDLVVMRHSIERGVEIDERGELLTAAPQWLLVHEATQRHRRGDDAERNRVADHAPCRAEVADVEHAFVLEHQRTDEQRRRPAREPHTGARAAEQRDRHDVQEEAEHERRLVAAAQHDSSDEKRAVDAQQQPAAPDRAPGRQTTPAYHLPDPDDDEVRDRHRHEHTGAGDERRHRNHDDGLDGADELQRGTALQRPPRPHAGHVLDHPKSRNSGSSPSMP